MSSTVNSAADRSHASSKGSNSRYTTTHSTSAAHDMISKLDALFKLKTKTVLMDSFDRLIPLKHLAKSIELRSSLEKIMPEMSRSSAEYRLADSKQRERTEGDEDYSDFDSDAEGSDFSVDLGFPTTLDEVLPIQVEASADKRAAKSIIRLSNAIIPLLSFYNASLEMTSTPALKVSSTPPKSGKNRTRSHGKTKITPNSKSTSRNSTPNTVASSITAGTPMSSTLAAIPVIPHIDTQEVHRAFHAVLQQVHRLETSVSTAALMYQAPQAPAQAPTGLVDSEGVEVPPPPPALVDELMKENNSKVYAHITSLEKQLHLVQDSKKRQYESLVAQLHASEQANSALKKKLEQAVREREEFVQVAVDKEKQLQASFLHLQAAQDEIKNLKGQVARIPRANRENLKQTTKATLENSRYSAGQFIKLTAQIDLLREELRRERQQSHETATQLQEATALAEGRAAHSDNVIKQLQSQIANSDYFVLHPNDTEEHHGDLDDSHLYLDARSHHSNISTTANPTLNLGTKPVNHPDSANVSHMAQVETVPTNGESSISSGSSRHSVLSDNNNLHEDLTKPNVQGSSNKSVGSLSRSVTPVPAVGNNNNSKVHAHENGSNSVRNSTPPRKQHTTQSTPPRTQTSSPARTPSAINTSHASPQRSRTRESVTVSPTRSSYERQLATVEQFLPSNTTHNTNNAHNTSVLGRASHSAHDVGNITTNTTATAVPKQPWRPSTPNPSPTHIRSGYYNFVHNVDVNSSHRAGSPYKALREDGFVFNPHHSLNSTTTSAPRRRSKGTSPVRSIRGKFHAMGASYVQDTHTSRQRSQSHSPYRRHSLSYTIGTSSHSSNRLHAHLHPGQDKHVPPQVPHSHVNKDLNLGRCTYCTHNLLELWTQKFDKFGPRSNRSSGQGRESMDAVEQGSSPEEGDEHVYGYEEEHSSEEHSSEEGENTQSAHSHHSVHSKHSKSTAHSAPHKSRTAVKDSSGNSISYALNRSVSEDPRPQVPSMAALVNPDLLPVGITTQSVGGSKMTTDGANHSISAGAKEVGASPQSVHSVHFKDHYGRLHSRSADHTHTSHGHHGHSHKARTPLGLRASRDYLDDMSAITEESQSVQQEHSRYPTTSLTAHGMHNAHTAHHLHSVSGGATQTPTAARNAKMGIADTGMSPPPPHNTPTSRAASHHHSTHHNVHHTESHSVHNNNTKSASVHSHSVLGSRSRDQSPAREVPKLRTVESPQYSRHSHTTHNTKQNTKLSNNNTSILHPVDSTETLQSFPVVPENSHTSQHTSELLHRLQERELYPKQYYTTDDARHLTPTELTTLCNTLVSDYNKVLMTLGNEIIVMENVKSDYKEEITESVSLVSTLKQQVLSLQSENDTLIGTINTFEADKSAVLNKNQELIHSMQEELLQCRLECEDLQEEKNSLKVQLLDAVKSYGNNNIDHEDQSLVSESRRNSFDLATGATMGHSASVSNSASHRNIHTSQSRSPTHSNRVMKSSSRDSHNYNNAREIYLRSTSRDQVENDHSDDEPSLSRAEEQALRVTAEARIERLQHDFTLQSAQLLTLQSTLAETQSQKGEISEESEKLKNELFHVEVQLAESREKLTLSENAVQTLNKECTTLRTSLHTLKEGKGDVLDTQFSEQQKLITHLQNVVSEQNDKLLHTEGVINVQQQLLTQKDVQIQQSKDAQYTQQHLYNALQLQLKESQEQKENVYSNENRSSLHELNEARQRAQQAEALSSVQAQLLSQKEHHIETLLQDKLTTQQALNALQQRLTDAERHLHSVNGHAHSAGNVSYVPASHGAAGQLYNINTATPSMAGSSNSNNNSGTGVTLSAASPDALGRIDLLRQQLDATFRELEDAKRGVYNNKVPSGSGSVSGASYHGPPTTPHSVHPLHSTSQSVPVSPQSVHSSYSTVTGTSLPSSNNNNHNYNYNGDLQYISSLAAIQEESTVRSGTSANYTADNASVHSHMPSVQNSSVHGSVQPSMYGSVYNNSVHGSAHNTHNSVHNQSVYNRSVGIADRNNGTNASVRTGNTAPGTPLHTMLGGMYQTQQQQEEQQQQADLQSQLHTELKDQLRTTTAQLQQQLQQQEQVDANTQAHIASLNATNVTLAARNTQLEERLRHSELRCKLLMDQIKNMPVSLSVAQAEKRVVEAKLKKATSTYAANLKKVNEGTSQKIHELTAYLQLERSERTKLESQLAEQKATIHQLSHHVQILRSQAQAQMTSSLYEVGGGGMYTSNNMGGTSGGGIGGGVGGGGHTNPVPEYTHTYSTATEVRDVPNTHSMAHSYRNEHTNDAHSVHHTHNAQNMQDTHHHVHHLHTNPPFSQTVPLTPMSIKGPLHHTFTPGTAHKNSIHTQEFRFTTSGSLPYATNLEAQRVQQSNNHINIIRASIPPAPWENA